MKLERLAYEPGALVDFYEAGLGALGALCERTWHDRLQVVAEGQPAKLWNPEGALHEIELHFVSADAASARNAAREVFPGCPLTFRLAEVLRPLPLALDRIVLAGEAKPRPPDPAVAEKLWRAQFPETNRWRLTAPLTLDSHFSLVALARCEIQAIDQHWLLHRLAISLPGGEQDEALARELSFALADPQGLPAGDWPSAEPARWQALLRDALESELAGELASIRVRQENYLRRELERIDAYFDHYESELAARTSRGKPESKVKSADRLGAARAEHARRRADQIARHEIRVQPHLDAVLLVAEPAWRACLEVERTHVAETVEASFVPRARRWIEHQT